MARINIEECWWSDPRRDALRRALGSETQDQVAVQAWRLGQEYWARGKLIPWKTYRALVGADALIEVGLAEVRETEDPRSNPVQAESKQDPSRLQACFVYVRGSSEYHSWVQERRLKGSTGGKKSAQRPRDAKGRLLKKSKQTPSSVQAESKGVQASGSGSGSDSGSNSDSAEETFAEGIEKNEEAGQGEMLPTPSVKPEGPSATAKVWRAYRHAYENRYGAPPPWSAKVGGQLKTFVGLMPAEDAPLVAGFFVTHQDAYYVKHMHQVWLLLRDAAKLHTEWVTGRKMTGAQARQAETHDSNVQAAQDYYRQKHGGAS